MSDAFFKRQHAKGKKAADVKTRYEGAADAILSDLFPEQQNAILDPTRKKSLLTPRRAGKTHTAIAYALIVACLNPDSRIPIITLTLKSAKRLYWIPMQKFSERYGLGIKFSYSDNSATLENGAKIFLGGAESKSDIEKFRGGSYKLALIDECKSFNSHVFDELLYEILYPATADCTGTIMIIGTPGSMLDGPFYEATAPGLLGEDGNLVTMDYYNPEPFWTEQTKVKPMWVRHHWTVQQNTFAPHIWENALEDKARKRWSDDNPIWVREYLGQWVPSEETQVYALQSVVRNAGGPANAPCVWRRHPAGNKHGLPKGEDWRYIMGVDFGFEDDFALVVTAYSPTHDCMYHVFEHKHPHMTVPHMARIIQQTIDDFDEEIEYMVADAGGLGLSLMESLNEMYGFFFEPAEKREKFDFIELLNSDLRTGACRILLGSDLYDEMMELQLELGGRTKKQASRMGKLKENRKQSNHLCDAFLYTWRFCYHHFSREKPVELEPETQAFFDDWDYTEAVEAAKKRDAADDLEWTDDVYQEGLAEWTDALLN